MNARILEDDTGCLEIYKDVEKDRWYVLACDIGKGLLRDYHVGDIISRPKYPGEIPEQCAQFRSNLRKHDPTSVGIPLYLLGRYYNWALLAIETFLGPGMVTLSAMMNPPETWKPIIKPYPNIYYHIKLPQEEPTDEPGWPARANEKLMMMAGLQNAVAQEQCIIHSPYTVNEMTGYCWDDKEKDYKPTHRDPVTGLYHDDCMIAAAIGIKVVELAQVVSFFGGPIPEG